MVSIAIDLDAVLADFIGGLVLDYNSYFNRSLTIDQVTEYKFTNFEPAVAQDLVDTFLKPGFFRNLNPTPHAVETVKKLLEAGHTIEICTAPPSKHCPLAVVEKLDWVAQWFPELTGKVTVTSNKFYIAADMLVDDFPKNISTWCSTHKHGVGYLVSLPWNKNETDLAYNTVRGDLKDLPKFIEEFHCTTRNIFAYRIPELKTWKPA